MFEYKCMLIGLYIHKAVRFVIKQKDDTQPEHAHLETKTITESKETPLFCCSLSQCPLKPSKGAKTPSFHCKFKTPPLASSVKGRFAYK